MSTSVELISFSEACTPVEMSVCFSVVTMVMTQCLWFFCMTEVILQTLPHPFHWQV